MWCWGNSELESGTDTTIFSGPKGPEGTPPPFDVEVELSACSDSNVCSSQSGPDGGVDALRSCAPDLTLSWEQGSPHAYGHAISLYDCNPNTGARNGEPVADCYGLIAYGEHEAAIMAVADGVSWGEPARRAARCAVLGVLHYLHAALCHLGAQQRQQHAAPAGCGNGKSRAGVVSSHQLFREMIQAVHAGQALILQQMGTLTTLVLSLVVPHSTQCDKYKRLVNTAKAGSWPWAKTGGTPRSWVALSLTVGDSSAWVWRAATQQVEELTAASHEGELRNARFTPGALGYATGEEPDLSNMTLSLTLVKPGDIVFLASDGVGDNYDPCILKLARPAPYAFEIAAHKEADPSQPPAMTPAQMQEQTLQLMSQAVNQIAAAATTNAAITRLGDVGAPALEGSGHAYQAAGLALQHHAGPGGERAHMHSGGGGTPGTPRSPRTPNSQAPEEPLLSAQALVLGMLDLTFKSTEPLRVATMERARQAEQERRAAGEGAARPVTTLVAREGSLCTDGPRVKPPSRIVMPPGKLDHATLCAFQPPVR